MSVEMTDEEARKRLDSEEVENKVAVSKVNELKTKVVTLAQPALIDNNNLSCSRKRSHLKMSNESNARQTQDGSNGASNASESKRMKVTVIKSQQGGRFDFTRSRFNPNKAVEVPKNKVRTDNTSTPTVTDPPAVQEDSL